MADSFMSNNYLNRIKDIYIILFMTIEQLTIINNKKFIIKSVDRFTDLVISVQENTECTTEVIKLLNEHLFNKKYSIVKKLLIINQFLTNLIEFNINRIINYIKLDTEHFIKCCHKSGGSFYFPLDDTLKKPLFCKFDVNHKYRSISGVPTAYELFQTRNNGKKVNFEEWSHITDLDPTQKFMFSI